MFLLYIRQAWELLKQNKLYSSIYIVGTGLAITLAMVLAIVHYIKIAPLYPEVNRNRTLVIKYMTLNFPKIDNMNSSGLSYHTIKEYLYTLETPEVVSGVLKTEEEFDEIELSDGKGTMEVSPLYVDHSFWQIFKFNFLDGKPFTPEEFRSGLRTTVISASLANTLFGTTKAEGRRIIFNGNEYRVSGVVKDVSLATPVTFAQLWIPYTVCSEELEFQDYGEGLLGSFSAYLMAPSVAEVDKVREEVEGVIQRINNSQDTYVVDLSGQPEIYWKTMFRRYSSQAIRWTEALRPYILMILALLLIPAANLAGMISSRMEKRLSEIGIREAFGASRKVLMNQILIENLFLTMLGGILGLLFSYLILFFARNWILTLFDSWPDMAPAGIDMELSIRMLFNPVVFLVAFGICFLLNLLSATIPAYIGLKKDIIYSLHEKV